MSTSQEYWDACLIRAWRQDQNLRTAIQNFESIVGSKITDSSLYRIPPKFIPGYVGVKVFVSRHLPKINDWLWGHGPEKDVALLKKLSASKYDSCKTAFATEADKALKATQDDIIRTREKRAFATTAYSQRNQKTDWGVTKGPVRTKRAR